LFDKQAYMKSYNQNYYKEHKREILREQKEKRTEEYFELEGHTKAIHNAIKRYASKLKWNLPIDIYKEFKRWAKNNDTYLELFQAWEESDFKKNLTPVVMRKVRKGGFVIKNLYWSTKGQHSWWNSLLDDIKRVNLNLEDVKRTENKHTKESIEKNIKLLKGVKNK